MKFVVKSGVYLILNLVNGKRYIGSSLKLQKRWNQHKHELRHKKHYNSYLQNAWNKYGEAAFKFEVLESVADPIELLKLEQWYIRSFNPEYNLCPNAGTKLGWVTPKETREKLRLALLGKSHSPERRIKNKESSIALHQSEKGRLVREKIRLARAKQIFTKETFRKQSESLKRRLRNDPEVLSKLRIQLNEARKKRKCYAQL